MRPLLFTAIIVVVLAIVLAILYFAAPATYGEKRTLTLTFEQSPAWRSSICIPGTMAGSPSWTPVSFTWSTSGMERVTIVVWPGGNIPDQSVYNQTGISGFGSYSSQGTEYFAAFGATDPSLVVTIELNYSLPGHTLGGPIAGPTC